MHSHYDIFSVRQNGDHWEACVTWDIWNPAPHIIVCRKAATQEEAHDLLNCLRDALVRNSGHTANVVEAWQQQLLPCRRT